MSDRLSARDRLLGAAAELFYNDGIVATGIDAIVAKAGVAKMSLYNNFESKAELVQAYIGLRDEEWRRLCAGRLEKAVTPQERILAVFDSYLDYAAAGVQPSFRGCGLLNAAAELPQGSPGRAAVAAQKVETERLFRENLRDLLPDDSVRAEDLAQHLSFLLEGAMVRAGLDGHDAKLRSARSIAASLLERL